MAQNAILKNSVSSHQNKRENKSYWVLSDSAWKKTNKMKIILIEHANQKNKVIFKKTEDVQRYFILYNFYVSVFSILLL